MDLGACTSRFNKKEKVLLFGGILGVLVVSFKREVYTARLSFIWVVKERGGDGAGAEFLTTLYALYSFINAL